MNLKSILTLKEKMSMEAMSMEIDEVERIATEMMDHNGLNYKEDNKETEDTALDSYEKID